MIPNHFNKILRSFHGRMKVKMVKSYRDLFNCINIHTVHGGWGAWSNWTDCTVTCGLGMASRDRQCDNPTPGRFGVYCTGQQNQFKNCMNRACHGKSICFKFISIQ